MIWLRQRALPSEPGRLITEIMINHELLMSSHHTASERALASACLERHAGTGLRVLIGGLGLGYTAFEALASPRVGHVEVVEFLSQVVDWMRDGRVPLSADLNADDRFQVVAGDVYARLAAPPERRYDLILIDVDHSPDERLGDGNANFYTPEGLELARAHLADGGVLGVWSYAECSPFAAALRSVFSHVEVEAVSFDNVLSEQRESNWLFIARD
jgi:spermidine synthase